MRSSPYIMLVLIVTVAWTAPAPDASDEQAAAAYRKSPTDPNALYDYEFSLLHLEKWKEAHAVIEQWRKAAPADPAINDAADLLGKLEREPDAKQREKIAVSWALAQKRAAEKARTDMVQGMQQREAGLKDLTREEAAHTLEALPKLKAQAEKEPTAEHWLAYADALMAAGDFKTALPAAESAAKADANSALAALYVAQLKGFDGKNGEEIRASLHKERVKAVIKKADR
jgi:tetratricopeptide (TPR) repeat protein